MLFAVLSEQGFVSALGLALDAWNKKFSLAASVALVLIMANALSFAFMHTFWKEASPLAAFELLKHSATIWVLLLILILFIVFFAALINCFLVLLFLETIRRKKDPEAESRDAVKRPILEPSI